MPQIKIDSSQITKNVDTGELFLIEFQGKFETANNASLSGMEIGQLDLNGDKPVFFIGNQKLIGKEVKLPKPLAILKQTQSSAFSEQPGEQDISALALIKKKIVFDSRPITIMR